MSPRRDAGTRAPVSEPATDGMPADGEPTDAMSTDGTSTEGVFDDGMPTDGDARSTEALAHLQRAALELIGAARAVLDIAEEAVREPGGVAGIVAETVAALSTAAAAAGRAAGGQGSDAKPASGPGDPAPRSPARGPVEHIRIS